MVEIRRTSVRFFVMHYAGHSEVWQVFEHVEASARTSESFDGLDGDHCAVSRYLFHTRERAEAFVDDAMRDFTGDYMSKLFEAQRIY